MLQNTFKIYSENHKTLLKGSKNAWVHRDAMCVAWEPSRPHSKSSSLQIDLQIQPHANHKSTRHYTDWTCQVWNSYGKAKNGTDRQSGRRRAKQQDQAALRTCPVQAPVTRWRASLRPHTGTDRASSPETPADPAAWLQRRCPCLPWGKEGFQQGARQLGFHIEKKGPWSRLIPHTTSFKMGHRPPHKCRTWCDTTKFLKKEMEPVFANWV